MTLLELEKNVSDLREEISGLKREQSNQLRYPMDDTSQRIIRDVIGSSSSGISLVSSGSFTGDTVISGLSGDSDEVYKLLITAEHSTAFDMSFQINEDTGANYEYLRHYATKQNLIGPNTGTDFATGSSIKTSFITQKNYICELNISAISGKKRILSANCVGIDGSANYYDTVNTLGIWTNTVDSIESMTIKTGNITEGRYFLFKL